MDSNGNRRQQIALFELMKRLEMIKLVLAHLQKLMLSDCSTATHILMGMDIPRLVIYVAIM